MTGLRPCEMAQAPDPGDAAVWVLRTLPEDGAVFVLRDTPVLLRLSHAVDPESVDPRTLRVLDPTGDVPSEVGASADGLVVIWEPRRLLVPGAEHVVVARGLRDRRGRSVAEHWSRFVPCGLSREDLRGS